MLLYVCNRKRGGEMDNIIKQHRAKKNLSQMQLAELLNVSLSTLRNWEKRRFQPNAHYMVQLSLHLDVSLNDIVMYFANKEEV